MTYDSIIFYTIYTKISLNLGYECHYNLTLIDLNNYDFVSNLIKVQLLKILLYDMF